jgi:glutamate synthase (NADPH/NADH) large chain
MDELTFQRRLYMGRRQAEKANKVDDPSFYRPRRRTPCPTKAW